MYQLGIPTQYMYVIPGTCSMTLPVTGRGIPVPGYLVPGYAGTRVPVLGSLCIGSLDYKSIGS
eukprot:3332136-Rhodomonas_salina.2